ncbi:YggN family protein [Vibrio amylolyticus]|uniref:YggN family protein n=1 Tax=Vibrio amylolyticus TaxID=2847292 RepID=UPI00354FCB97
MKKYALFLSLMVSQVAVAGQCQVNLKNEIHLNTHQLEVVQASGDSAVVDNANDLYIGGEKVDLTADQKSALKQYREDINQYLPQAKKIASDSLALANDIIDDVAESLEAPEAFDDMKASMKSFLADLEARYYKEGDLVLPADSFNTMTQSWSEDFEKAKALFNKEFIASAFDAMSEKMQKEGGLNLTELADSLAELKAKVEQRLEEHDLNVEKQTEEFCDSLDGMAEQEEQLHQKIPALKDYQLFTI